MIDRPSSRFVRMIGTDPDDHADSCVFHANLDAKYRATFIAEAQKVGFTKEQAEFMAKFVSLTGHVHEYRNDGHDRLTSSQVDKGFTAEYERNRLIQIGSK